MYFPFRSFSAKAMCTRPLVREQQRHGRNGARRLHRGSTLANMTLFYCTFEAMVNCWPPYHGSDKVLSLILFAAMFSSWSCDNAALRRDTEIITRLLQTTEPMSTGTSKRVIKNAVIHLRYQGRTAGHAISRIAFSILSFAVFPTAS